MNIAATEIERTIQGDFRLILFFFLRARKPWGAALIHFAAPNWRRN